MGNLDLKRECESGDSKEGHDDKRARVEPDRKIIVAVDFGTTFSGLAWAQTRRPSQQTTITQWPDGVSGGQEGVTRDKVPTQLTYDGEDIKWGCMIGDLDKKYEWFKLGLDTKHHELPSTIKACLPGFQTLPPNSAVSAEQLAIDYLTCFRNHVEQVLRYNMPASTLGKCPIEYILTVPAFWSEAAQSKTRKCAEKAGMGVGSALQLISEPEAAAVYALEELDPCGIKVGDTFVLVDAGGGTVDLISYTVVSLQPTLKVEEAAPGSGSLAGSSFVNRIFQEKLKARFKDEREWDDDVLREATNRFEASVKPSFKGIRGETFKITVPGLKDNIAKGVQRGLLTMDGAEIEEIFRPVVQEIKRLVLEQIRATQKPVSAVLLVGGFGSSPFLRGQLRSVLGGIELLQSPNGWTAVARGALRIGLASESLGFATVGVSGRAARKYYETDVVKPYDPDQHGHCHKWQDMFTDEYRVEVMDWFIKKGSIIEENKPHRLAYVQRFRKSGIGRPRQVTATIFVYHDPSNNGAPIFRDDSVMELVVLKADLRRIPLRKFPVEKGADGRLYYECHYYIEITHHSAYTKYELIHGGINYGAVTAEYV